MHTLSLPNRALRAVPEQNGQSGPGSWHFEKSPLFRGSDSSFLALLVFAVTIAVLFHLLFGVLK